MERLSQLFHTVYGHPATAITPLTGEGSNRKYFRLSDTAGNSCIGVVNPHVQENRAFLYLAKHLLAGRFPVPKILAVDKEEKVYLQSDLGDLSLHTALAEWRNTNYSERDEHRSLSQHGYNLLKRTLRLLPHIQIEGGRHLATEQLLPPQTFCHRAILFDLHYFKYCFLKPCDLPFNEMALEDDFEQMAADLTATQDLPSTFLYRDFQSRNIMIRDSAPWLIDFQGGRIGPIYYDLASFLWQASARYPETLRNVLIEEYFDELCQLVHMDHHLFHSRLNLFVLFRLLQVLGAYGLRGLFERKTYFLQSIPLAIDNLHAVTDTGVALPYPMLTLCLQQLFSLPLTSLINQ